MYGQVGQIPSLIHTSCGRKKQSADRAYRPRSVNDVNVGHRGAFLSAVVLANRSRSRQSPQ